MVLLWKYFNSVLIQAMQALLPMGSARLAATLCGSPATGIDVIDVFWTNLKIKIPSHSAGGVTAGTLTAGAGVPAAIIGCNVAQVDHVASYRWLGFKCWWWKCDDNYTRLLVEVSGTLLGFEVWLFLESETAMMSDDIFQGTCMATCAALLLAPTPWWIKSSTEYNQQLISLIELGKQKYYFVDLYI